MHMKNALLLQNDVHELKINSGGSAALVAENGVDVMALFLRRKSDTSDEIVVNSCIEGAWGAERIFRLPPIDESETPSVWFKANENGLEVWTSAYAGQFERFTTAHRKRVRFVRLNQAINSSSSLTSSLESIDYAAMEIEAHLLYRRMDALERQLKNAGLSTEELA